MLDMIHHWRSKSILRKQLLTFLGEMEKNLEAYYVMEQRQFITAGFLMQCWPQVQDLDIIKRQEAIKAYASSLLDFNKALQEYKSYEQWYTSDVRHKDPENAKKLHGLKNTLDHKLKTLEAIIVPAGQALERELLNLGFIST